MPAPVSPAASAVHGGAYGMALAGAALGADATDWLGVASADWPLWSVERHPIDATDRPVANVLDDHVARIGVSNGGTCELEFDARIVRLYLAENEPTAAVLHPGLAAAFVLSAHQRRLACFHEGVVVLHGVAWGVLGHKGAGKSTTLAELDRAGHSVLADDLLIVRDGQALRGPRFIDLRPGAAPRFADAIDVGRLGLRHRHRLRLAAAPDEAPFGGWIVPTWSDELGVASIEPQHRIAVLADLLSVRAAPIDPSGLLDLAAVPMLTVGRPKDFGRLGDYLELLVEATGAAVAGAR